MRFPIAERIGASFALVGALAASTAAQEPASETIEIQIQPGQIQPGQIQSSEELRLREPTLSVDVDVRVYLDDAESPTRQPRWFRRPVLFLAAGVAGLAGSMIGLTRRSSRRSECDASMACELPWGRRDAIAAGVMGSSSIVMFGGLMGLVIRGLARVGRRIEAQRLLSSDE